MSDCLPTHKENYYRDFITFQTKIIFSFLSFLYFSACKTLECTKEFTVCVESFNTSLPAKCDCRAGFVQVDRECKTSENIVRVVFFKLNITFKEEYKDVKNPVTLELKTRIEQSLHRTLNLSAYEYVAVTNITRGSVIVDFVVLLAQNSTDNKLSIEEKLRTEVRTNKTGHLHEYFPVSRQAIVVLGKSFYTSGTFIITVKVKKLYRIAGLFLKIKTMYFEESSSLH